MKEVLSFLFQLYLAVGALAPNPTLGGTWRFIWFPLLIIGNAF